MAIEIERKFLVKRDCWDAFAKPPGTRLQQAYLSQDPAHTVRVRSDGRQAWLTVKGASSGAARPEFEYSIPLTDAQEMISMRRDHC